MRERYTKSDKKGINFGGRAKNESSGHGSENPIRSSWLLFSVTHSEIDAVEGAGATWSCRSLYDIDLDYPDFGFREANELVKRYT